MHLLYYSSSWGSVVALPLEPFEVMFRHPCGRGGAAVDDLYHFSAYLPLTLRLWLNEKLFALRQILVENGILTAASGSSATGR